MNWCTVAVQKTDITVNPLRDSAGLELRTWVASFCHSLCWLWILRPPTHPTKQKKKMKKITHSDLEVKRKLVIFCPKYNEDKRMWLPIYHILNFSIRNLIHWLTGEFCLVGRVLCSCSFLVRDLVVKSKSLLVIVIFRPQSRPSELVQRHNTVHTLFEHVWTLFEPTNTAHSSYALMT